MTARRRKPTVPMRALSLTQPYAKLIQVGAKTVETRSWSPPKKLIGQRIAVHAAKGCPLEYREAMHLDSVIRAALLEASVCLPHRVGRRLTAGGCELGFMVATAKIADVVLTDRCRVEPEVKGWKRVGDEVLIGPAEHAFGNYEAWRFAWLLEDAVPLAQPVEVRGYQKLWRWAA